MNKNRLPLDSKVRKKQAKEIKKGQKLLEAEENSQSNHLTVDEALKKQPVKTQKIDKPLIEAAVKNMQIKKKKALSKQSKRTTPGKVDNYEFAPSHDHIEGERWSKTLVKQSVNKGKALTAKIKKQAASRPKRKKTS